MTKIYEIQGKDRCRINLNYCGVKIVAEFKTVSGGQLRSRIVTRDRFIQDALEHDIRYGKLFICTQTFDDEAMSKGGIAQKEENRDTSKKIASVKSLNDALVWFSKKGETPASDEEVKSLMEKYNVSFPNWKQDK